MRGGQPTLKGRWDTFTHEDVPFVSGLCSQETVETNFQHFLEKSETQKSVSQDYGYQV